MSKVSPSDRAATPKEIATAISSLTDAEIFKLQQYAHRRTYTLRSIKGDQDWGADILQEAMLKVASGEKAWPIEKINIMTCLIQAIKNIAGHEIDRLMKHLSENSDEEFEDNIVDSASGNFSSHIYGLKNEPECLINADRTMALIREVLKKEPPLDEIFEYKISGYEPLEIREALEITEAEYNAFFIKLKRRLVEEINEGGQNEK